MKTAISVPDADFDRYERLAARHGLNRSEFYRRAAARFADELDGEAAQLTARADAVLARVGQPSDSLHLSQTRQVHTSLEW